MHDYGKSFNGCIDTFRDISCNICLCCSSLSHQCFHHSMTFNILDYLICVQCDHFETVFCDMNIVQSCIRRYKFGIYCAALIVGLHFTHQRRTRPHSLMFKPVLCFSSSLSLLMDTNLTWGFMCWWRHAIRSGYLCLRKVWLDFVPQSTMSQRKATW